MQLRNSWSALGLIITLGFLIGMLGFSLWYKIPVPVARVTWSPQVQWITSVEPSYRFYARRTFNLTDTVQTAWLRLSGDNDFILYVNGKRVVRDRSAFNNAFGFSRGVSDRFQNFNDNMRYRLKTGGNYLTGSTRDWKLTVYVDLTPLLRPGKNVVALEVQQGGKKPRAVVEGAIYSGSDSLISLTTGETNWRVFRLSENHQGLQWFDPDFSDQNWSEAQVLGSIKEATYSRISQNLFERPLQGTWITGTPTEKGEVWLRNSFQVTQKYQRAFVRFAGNGEYALLINGLLVKRYDTENGKKLHIYEVTNFLKPGINTLAVRLASSINSEGALLDSRTLSSRGFLGFFLDGWVETERSKVTDAIATDNTWTSLTHPVTNWDKGEGEGQPATLLAPPNPQSFRRTFEGNAYLLNYPHYLWHQSLWQLGGIVCALAYAWMLSRFWLKSDRLQEGAALLLPGTLFLVSIGLLKHRYGESEIGLIFAQPSSNLFILLGFLFIVLITLLWSQIRLRLAPKYCWSLWFFLGLLTCISFTLLIKVNVLIVLAILSGFLILALLWKLPLNLQLSKVYVTLQLAWQAWGQWLLLILIITIGFGLRAYNLGFIDLDNDENTSLDTARGILRTGAPLLTSGIWYTRGPFYHYLLAFWLQILGDSVVNARFLSVLWGTATLILVYFFTRKVTGKVWIALVVIAILAINPWEIWYSRNIRFYQVLQFLCLLSFWSFFKGFIERSGRKYQYLFFVAITLMLLTQEVTVTLLPVFLVGFLWYYRPFNLFREWRMVLSAFISLLIFTYNIIFFSVKCLTPWVSLSDSTDSYLKPHLLNVTQFTANFLVGPDRIQTIYSCFFLIGFVYFLILKENKKLFFFISIIVNIILITILSYQTAERYAYTIYPLFVMLAIYSAICITNSIGRYFQFVLKGLLPLKAIAGIFLALLLFSNLQPGRVLAGYQEAISRRNTQVSEYVRTHRQPGDVYISPNPPAASISLGRLDYFLFGIGFFDGIYWRDGRAIDRWAGGVIISNIDQLNRVLEKSERVWINVDETRETRFTPEMNQYIQTLGKPVFETFGVRLRLWQPEDGLLPRIPNEGKDLGAY
ncbi:glycosyltransferase family 39 protein [Aerosakkonemataceae cyanobacterium BLCC-F50]|uniref:Glycosyltransferase family 39 protein n=1 Tax=Floridaenema flaviceps BLCC-F50 TaxID=3153642 RepID=A0ABV4Y0C3_9CYAN